MYTAIVTGGSRGIGFAIARAILDAGGRVMIAARDGAAVDRAARELLRHAGGDASRVAARETDVRRRAAVDALVAETVERFGGFNTLVNNAGVGAFKDVASMSDEDWAATIETNLTGVFYGSRAAIPHLRQAGGGWIITIASLAARNYFPNGAAYCASKAAVVAFCESLMQEVRFDGIRVSVVLPGSVATEFNGPTSRAESHAWMLTPDDVAEAVMGLLRHPVRSLPSRVEIRPAKTR